MPLVEYYIAFVKRDDGSEERCNTTDTTCHFYCMCGYTYLITMFTYNQAGSSPPGDVFNYTTSKSYYTVHTHTHSFVKSLISLLFLPSSLLPRGRYHSTGVDGDPGDHVVVGAGGGAIRDDGGGD